MRSRTASGATLTTKAFCTFAMCKVAFGRVSFNELQEASSMEPGSRLQGASANQIWLEPDPVCLDPDQIQPRCDSIRIHSAGARPADFAQRQRPHLDQNRSDDSLNMGTGLCSEPTPGTTQMPHCTSPSVLASGLDFEAVEDAKHRAKVRLCKNGTHGRRP